MSLPETETRDASVRARDSLDRRRVCQFWRWLAYAVLLLAFFVRLYRVGSLSLWMDEILQLQMAQASADVIWDYVRFLPLGPAYTYGLKAWTTWVGTSELALRLPPAGAGLLGIALFYRYLRQWLMEPAALVGCVLLALSPFHLFFSQESRPYTLAVAAVLASALLFQRLLDEQGWRWVLLHGLFLALAGHLHYTALVVAGGQVAMMLALHITDRARWTRALVSWSIALALMMIIMPDALHALRITYGSYPESINVWSTIQTVAAGYGKYLLFPDYDASLIRGVAPFTLLGLALLALPALRSSRPLWATALGTVGLQFGWTFVALPLIGGLDNPPFNERHFLWALPMILSVVALGVQYGTQSRHRLARMWVGALLGATLVSYVAGDVAYLTRFIKNVGRPAIEFVAGHAQATDLVICNSSSASTTWSVYGDPELKTWDKPVQVDGEWRFSSQVGFVIGEELQRTQTWEQALGHSRIWVFYLPGQGPGELVDSLRNLYPYEQTWVFGDIDLFLFTQ